MKVASGKSARELRVRKRRDREHETKRSYGNPLAVGLSKPAPGHDGAWIGGYVVGKTENSLAESLGRAHGALLADLRELEKAVGTASGEALAELRDRLRATDAHISEHFRFEEQNGYMDAVRKREPRLVRPIDELAQEHGELRQTLAALTERAGACTSLDDALREEIRDWIRRVRRHEARENELVQGAFNLDIGPED
jgi:hypothetical protein